MKLTKEQVIAGIYEHYDDLKFIEDVNNITFFRKAQLKKEQKLNQPNQNKYEKCNH